MSEKRGPTMRCGRRESERKYTRAKLFRRLQIAVDTETPITGWEAREATRHGLSKGYMGAWGERPYIMADMGAAWRKIDVVSIDAIQDAEKVMSAIYDRLFPRNPPTFRDELDDFLRRGGQE